jgi:hypothetical protein
MYRNTCPPARPLTDRLVVIGCGWRKAATMQPPALLYTGTYFRACLATALAITGGRRDRVLILSAHYGLLTLDGPPIWPYNVRLRDPHAITIEWVREQAAGPLAVAGERVTALCGAPYAAVCRHVWTDVATPLAGLGIGQQLAAMKRWRCTLAAVEVTDAH